MKLPHLKVDLNCLWEIIKHVLTFFFLGVEACIKRFLDSAKSLEADFLRKQMYSRVNHPQEVTKEVIIDYLQL